MLRDVVKRSAGDVHSGEEFGILVVWRKGGYGWGVQQIEEVSDRCVWN